MIINYTAFALILQHDPADTICRFRKKTKKSGLRHINRTFSRFQKTPEKSVKIFLYVLFYSPKYSIMNFKYEIKCKECF